MGKSLTSMNIVLGVVNTGLYKGLKLASARVAKFAAKMKAIGSSITMSFTMPFALIAGAGVKMAMDFEKSMTKIQTLVLGSAADMDKYAEGVKRISSVTAVSATETAEGLYFLTSAGLRGVNALETLTTVNKAVALGMGESTDLARVAAAAQNAYGEETITATEAIDKFGMAVRTGMFESKDLAQSLGTQVGMAAELGISFDELLANISTYTKTTGDANSATTGFGGVMMALTKETSKGGKALAKVGMSYEELRASVQDKGLAATLFEMKDAFAAGGVQMTEFFGKSQAVKNIMGVLGEQGDNYIDILNEMGESADFTADAFDVLSQTPGFKIEKSINSIKLNFQEIGDIIMPTVAKLIQGVSNAIQWFGNLDKTTKVWILSISGVIALAGPLLSFFGFLTSVIAMVISPIGLIIVGLTALGVAIYKNWQTVKKWIVNIVNYFIRLYNESMVFRGAIQFVIMAFKNLWEQCKFTFLTIWTIVKTAAKNLGTLLGGMAKMIMGVFTLSWSDVEEGWNDITDGIKTNLTDAFNEIEGNATEAGENIAENINTAVNNTLRSSDIEFIDEEDIDNGIAAMTDWAKQGLAKVKELFEGAEGDLNFDDLFGDIPSAPPSPTGGSGDGGTGGGDDGGGVKDWKPALDKNKSALRTHLEGTSQMWKDHFAKQDENWLAWGQKTQEITLTVTDFAMQMMGQLNSIADQYHKNDMIRLDNEYNSELAKLEGMGLSEKEFKKQKEILDEDYAEKKKELDKKQAKREKKMAVFNAIINTAAGIAKALPNIILAGIVGIMGAAQILAIQSQPLPLAKGGLAFAPTHAIVGDNPNAQNDPEVIAPLSKLKSMLGDMQQQTVRVVGTISGNEIVISSDKARIGMARYV